MKKILFPIVLSAFSCAGVFAQTPAELKSWLPPIPGWAVDEQIEVFEPDNLFDRINGAAPLFIENNFREMTSLEYKRGDDYITIQAYRHATPADAFGMYASERSPELPFFPIGGEAQGDEANVFFFAGPVYVKMWGNAAEDISQTLRAIAKGLADKIDPETDYPVIVRAFPAENKVPYSEAFITSNYIGHHFLNDVYTAEYQVNGRPFQAFIVAPRTENGAEEALKKYMAFTKQPLDISPGIFMVNDRYNGDIPVLWQGNYLIGVFSANGEAMPDTELFLKTIGEKL